MKNYVSYVIQSTNEHTYHSQIIDIKSPPYNFSSEPQVFEVMKWAKNKQAELPANKELVILSVYKI